MKEIDENELNENIEEYFKIAENEDIIANFEKQ